MKICFMCDLHLPTCKSALQYDVLDCAIKDILEKKPDCIVYAGDVTSDGNEQTYDFFIEKMRSLTLPLLYVPGGSDLRSDSTRDSIKTKASPTKNTICGTVIYALCDCEKTVSDAEISEINSADGKSVVFMHHPIEKLSDDSREKMLLWRKSHPDTALFYGSEHFFSREENTVGLTALDPDKSVGECPCVTYYDTETREIEKWHYDAPIPEDFAENFGISCYRPLEQIKFATERKLKNLELRPNCIKADFDKLKALIDEWRASGGENLSVHLPDIGYLDGKVFYDDSFYQIVDIVNRIGADRVTQHVPKVSVKAVNESPEIIDKICEALASLLAPVEKKLTVGVENMHMAVHDPSDERRRFGFIPKECLLFMKKLDEKTEHNVGINFDIGHAQNNAPFNNIYPIGTWLSEVGQYTVGYHFHQVVDMGGGDLENHMAITALYDRMISYASFFKCWETGRINKVPIILEMRPDGAYEKTLETFGI